MSEYFSLPVDHKMNISVHDEINDANWIWAKTYAEIAPHWYIRLQDYPFLYGLMFRLITDHGIDENYTNHKGTTYICRYLYYGEHKYWCMHPIINRALIGEDNG